MAIEKSSGFMDALNRARREAALKQGAIDGERQRVYEAPQNEMKSIGNRCDYAEYRGCSSSKSQSIRSYLP